MTQDIAGAAPNIIDDSGSSRTSEQHFYNNGGTIIFEYQDGVVAMDCSSFIVNGFGRAGYVEYVPENYVIIDFTEATQDRDFTVEYSTAEEEIIETEYFSECKLTTITTKKLIAPRMNKMKLDKLALFILKQHGYDT